HRAHAAVPFAEGVPADAPEALVVLARAALTDDPTARLRDAAALGDGLQAWVTGAEQHARAEATLAEAMASAPRIAGLWESAADRRRRAQTQLDALSTFARAEEKEPIWAEEDRADELETEAAVLEAEWLQQVGAALAQANLEEAHDALADHYARRLRHAEVERRPQEVARLEVHLARHDRGRHAALLRPEGAVTVVTDPPGATVRAFRYVEQKRRLVEVFERELGVTPLVDVRLPRGSWMLELDHPERPAVRYPVYLERGEAWDGVRPGDREPFPIVLPEPGEIGPDEVYVPAGWFWSGGDAIAAESLPRRRLWADGLAVRRHLVTEAEFSLLRDLATDLEGIGPNDLDRDDRRASLPLVGLSFSEVQRVVSALRHQTSQPWRLPNELEFERYARGVDGRYLPWGDHHEPSWANVFGHDPEFAEVDAVDAHPLDISPFGVVGCVGNVREFCGHQWLPDGPSLDHQGIVNTGPPFEPRAGDLIVTRGGHWRCELAYLRLAARFADPPDKRTPLVGLRLVRPLPSGGDTPDSSDQGPRERRPLLVG
ncbi:MAG: SUMF1/EgtB/PvdO family nonheme iron enzyme, partial [Myxococcota bacterium]